MGTMDESRNRQELLAAQSNYLERRRWFESDVIAAKMTLGIHSDDRNAAVLARHQKELDDFDAKHAWIAQAIARANRTTGGEPSQ